MTSLAMPYKLRMLPRTGSLETRSAPGGYMFDDNPLEISGYPSRSQEEESSSRAVQDQAPSNNKSPSITTQVGAIVSAVAERVKESSRGVGLQSYLRNLQQSSKITETTALLAWNAWIDINEAMSRRLAVPDASSSSNQGVFYTWDRNQYHLEMDISPEGIAEMFFRNRETGQLWDAEYDLSGTVPDEIIEKLRLFTNQ